MAVVSAIAVPRYARSLERYRVDAAAARIIADLAYAQSRARTTSSTKRVSFDISKDSYTLEQIADIKHETVPYVVDLSSQPYGVSIDSVDFVDPISGLGPENVDFDGYGVPDSGGEVVISAGAQSRTIELDDQTGKARVK